MISSMQHEVLYFSLNEKVFISRVESPSLFYLQKAADKGGIALLSPGSEKKPNPPGFFRFLWVFNFFGFFRDSLFLVFFSLYFININSDKKFKFLTHNSYFKSELKYSRSNLGNQQGENQFRWVFFHVWAFWC